jgi:RNA polymerase sigma-70 factor (ECF subfamily)
MSTALEPDVAGSQLTEGLERVFREHYQLIYRTAFKITRSAEDAEDILQTIFLRLLRSDFPPDFQRHPKSYLYRAAVNASLDTIRAREKRVLVGTPETSKHAESSDASNLEAIHTRLYQAIAELTSKSAQILILRYVHNYSDAEIAKLLSTSRGTIAVSLYRSRARLKKIIRGWTGGIL